MGSGDEQDAFKPAGPAAVSQPRGARARQAILEAADDLLVEQGFAGVTIEGIAARAGVAKQTIYRWWTSKVEVLMDSLLDDAEQDLPPIDTGQTAQDLREHLSRLAQFLAHDPAGQVLRALIGHAQHDPRVARQLEQRYFGPRRDQDREILQRGLQRGEIKPPLDADAALDALEGPIYYRALIADTEADQTFINALIDHTFPTLTSTREITRNS